MEFDKAENPIFFYGFAINSDALPLKPGRVGSDGRAGFVHSA